MCLLDNEGTDDMKVRELMTSNPATCTRDTRLEEVARMMVEHDCGAIPVVESNGQSGKPAGIITDRDITTRIVAQGRNPLEKTVRDAMTTTAVTVRIDDDLQHCADLMEEKQLRRMIVVDESGKVCGIVAQADIARHRDDLTSELVEEVSEPRRSRR